MRSDEAQSAWAECLSAVALCEGGSGTRCTSQGGPEPRNNVCAHFDGERLVVKINAQALSYLQIHVPKRALKKLG